MNSGGPPEPSRPPATPTSTPKIDRTAEEAAAAYKRIKEYVQEHPEEYETIIAKIEAEREKLRKTTYWDSVEVYLQQAKEKKDHKEREKRLDESLAKVTSIENNDPRYEQRAKIQDMFKEAHAAAGNLGDAAKAKVDDAEKAYERRYQDAGTAAASPLMQQARVLANQGKYDEALAALDAFPTSFSDCKVVEEIAKLRERIEEKKQAPTVTPTPTPPPQQMPEWMADLQRVFKALQTDTSEATFKDAVPVLEKALANIEVFEQAKILSPNQRFQIRCTSNYFMAIYLSQFKNDQDKAFAHMHEALRFGVGKESIDFIEKQALLANLRKDARYKAFLEKYTKKYVDTSRRWLGVVGCPIFPQGFSAMGFAADEGGFLVAGVIGEMVGEKLGLTGGDVVISFNGEKLPRVGAYTRLDELLEKTKPETDYALVVRKGSSGERVTLTVRW
jgi:hypothetical protein